MAFIEIYAIKVSVWTQYKISNLNYFYYIKFLFLIRFLIINVHESSRLYFFVFFLPHGISVCFVSAFSQCQNIIYIRYIIFMNASIASVVLILAVVTMHCTWSSFSTSPHISSLPMSWFHVWISSRESCTPFVNACAFVQACQYVTYFW